MFHEAVTLPADLLVGVPPEHPKLVKIAWSGFTLALATLLAIVLSLPIPDARAQRPLPTEVQRHLDDAAHGYQRITTIEQQLGFANERIRELHKDVEACRKTIQDLQVALAVMDSTVTWMKIINSAVLGAFVAIGGLIMRKIWKIGK